MSRLIVRLRRIAPLVLAGVVAAGGGAIMLRAANAGEPQETAPSGLRRLTEAEYRNAIGDIFGRDIEVAGRFEPDLRVEGLLAVGASRVSVTRGGLEQYEDIARNVARQVTDAGRRDKLVGCGPSEEDVKGLRCAHAFLTRIGLRLYRRPLARREADALAASAVDAAGRLGDFHAGLAAVLAGMLTSPEFLFRIDGAALAGGQLDGYAKASRLSFLLWNTTPDDELLAAAGRGELDAPAGVVRQVDRLMSSPRYRDGVRAFFTDLLQLDELGALSKDTLIYPAFTPATAEAAREQTLRTITDLLVDRDGDTRDLFTSRRIAMTRELGPVYDIPVRGAGWYVHEFPAGDPRAGLLTQASFLALHAHPGRTSPTLRGKAIREIFLCEKVPSPPANVNFAVVQDVNNPTLKTTRARLQAHLDDEECASCHKRTDPLGLGLEQFDGAGQFRATEHDELIDVTGKLDAIAFDGAAELGQRLHDSPEASACLVRTAWRYANGRDPRADDLLDIARLNRTFVGASYRFSALMRSLALERATDGTPAAGRHAAGGKASKSAGKFS